MHESNFVRQGRIPNLIPKHLTKIIHVLVWETKQSLFPPSTECI